MAVSDTSPRVAVVTGASSGIGLYTALGVARGGMRVIMTGRDHERTETARRASREAAVALRRWRTRCSKVIGCSAKRTSLTRSASAKAASSSASDSPIAVCIGPLSAVFSPKVEIFVRV